MTAPSRFLTASNLLSLSRVLLALLFALVMISGERPARLWGAVLMVVAALTDKFDGILARRYGDITEWGKLLDPLADKIAVGVVALVLLKLGDIPPWFVAAVLARDLLIFAGGLYVQSRTGVILQSNQTGKWAVGVVSLALFALVLQWGELITTILLAASLAMLLVSFAIYLTRFLAALQRPAGPPGH